jgi:hypothetical protein
MKEAVALGDSGSDAHGCGGSGAGDGDAERRSRRGRSWVGVAGDGGGGVEGGVEVKRIYLVVDATIIFLKH